MMAVRMLPSAARALLAALCLVACGLGAATTSPHSPGVTTEQGTVEPATHVAAAVAAVTTAAPTTAASTTVAATTAGVTTAATTGETAEAPAAEEPAAEAPAAEEPAVEAPAAEKPAAETAEAPAAEEPAAEAANPVAAATVAVTTAATTKPPSTTAAAATVAVTTAATTKPPSTTVAAATTVAAETIDLALVTMCAAAPGNGQSVTDPLCAPCADGQTWWPCDVEGLCLCGPASPPAAATSTAAPTAANTVAPSGTTAPTARDATTAAPSEADSCASVRKPYDSKCTGCPPMYGGKLCASTTRYNDRVMGSCGCAESGLGARAAQLPDWHWSLTSYTAALNAKSLDPVKPLLAWCPSHCGQCYELCSTGGSAQGRQPFGTESLGGRSCRVFKVVNRCGDGYKEYPEWCSNELSWVECRDDPAACARHNSTNMYGYPAHFDLQDADLQVTAGLGWDNIEVTFEPVSCDRWQGPASTRCPACEVAV